MLHFEHTDTFGGESNYAWVRRLALTPEARADLHLVKDSDRAIVRAAKKWAGLNGVRCNVSNFGDMIEIRPRGICQVVFVTWED